MATKKAAAKKSATKKGKSSFGPRLAPDLHTQASEQSKATGISLAFVTRKALEHFVAGDFFWMVGRAGFEATGREMADSAVRTLQIPSKGKKGRTIRTGGRK